MKGVSFIESDGLIVVDLFNGDFAHLQDVCGGSVECAPSSDIVTIWCNEDGKGLELPVNGPANKVWALYDIYDCLSWDRLVGNVVITGGTDDDGETMDLPEDELRRIIDLLDKRSPNYGLVKRGKKS